MNAEAKDFSALSTNCFVVVFTSKICSLASVLKSRESDVYSAFSSCRESGENATA